MTLTPLPTLTHRHQVEDNFIILQKIEYSDVFLCRSGYRQCTEFLKTDSESLFPDGSGHIFNFYLAPFLAEKTCLESGYTDPRGFAVQIRPEPSGNKLSESVFKNSVHCP
jgi:hypothetical protein